MPPVKYLLCLINIYSKDVKNRVAEGSKETANTEGKQKAEKMDLI